MKIAIPASLDHSEVQNFYLNESYIKFIQIAGYCPVIITPQNAELINDCAGLVLPGGIDIDPIYYNYNNYSSRATDPEKDEFERKLLHSFVAAKKPIFCICRGFQLAFLEFCKITNDERFAFAQDIDGHNQNELKIKRSFASHFIEELDQTIKPVNSMHHQACLVKQQKNKVYEKLIPIATTTKGSPKNSLIIEAFLIPDWNLFAVQWHIEEMNDTKLMTDFFNEHFQV
jgi:gamma-glutamyl-gamma-aminobutyrate hydrolase PuuD